MATRRGDDFRLTDNSGPDLSLMESVGTRRTSVITNNYKKSEQIVDLGREQISKSAR